MDELRQAVTQSSTDAVVRAQHTTSTCPPCDPCTDVISRRFIPADANISIFTMYRSHIQRNSHRAHNDLLDGLAESI
jgi:hypothetical protein